MLSVLQQIVKITVEYNKIIKTTTRRTKYVVDKFVTLKKLAIILKFIFSQTKMGLQPIYSEHLVFFIYVIMFIIKEDTLFSSAVNNNSKTHTET